VTGYKTWGNGQDYHQTGTPFFRISRPGGGSPLPADFLRAESALTTPIAATGRDFGAHRPSTAGRSRETAGASADGSTSNTSRLSPAPRVQLQPPTRKPPLVCDPNPRDTVPDPEGAEEHKEPLSASHTKDDHREAGVNADRGDQGGHDAVGKGEIREMALHRRDLRPDAPGRMEQSTRQLQADGRFRSVDDETDVVFLFPRPVSAFRGHVLLNTISQDFPRGNHSTAYTNPPLPVAPSGLIPAPKGVCLNAATLIEARAGDGMNGKKRGGNRSRGVQCFSRQIWNAVSGVDA